MRTTPLFEDRFDAGRVLADRILEAIPDISADPSLLVLALPRGGVPVGLEVARALHAGLDVFLVRKLGLPGQEELAIGAVASGGLRVLNHDLIEYLGLSQKVIDQITTRELGELKRRELLYREGLPAVPVEGRPVVLVDDGLATGATMKAATRALREASPRRLVVAVPVAGRQTCDELLADADRIICAATPEPFVAVGIWYEDFAQISDKQVRDFLLARRKEVATVAGLPG